MPELPEVETVRRGLAPVMEGATIRAVDLRRPDLRFPFPDAMAKRLAGRRVDSLSRRAKYLVACLDDGQALVSHLGMSGSYRIEADEVDASTPGAFHLPRGKDSAHDHVVFHLARAGSGAIRVIYNDPRRFGFMFMAPASALNEHPHLARLGVEPTGNALSGAVLAELFSGRRTPLKAALLDQGAIAGLGNIYVCEALWRGGLSPFAPAASLAGSGGAKNADALATAIRAVIAEAIEAGGSSLRDHVGADGALGYFQHRFSVYDREGEACPRPRCDGVVLRAVQSGRSTFHCPRCQKPGAKTANRGANHHGP